MTRMAAMTGRMVTIWVLIIASFSAIVLVMVLPTLFPDSQVLRWAEVIFVLLIFPIIVFVGARSLAKK